MPKKKKDSQTVEIKAVPESNPPSENEDALQSAEIEWCVDPDCSIPVQHVWHEKIVDDDNVSASKMIASMNTEDRGPTGMGKSAVFTPPEERKPSKLSLDKTY